MTNDEPTRYRSRLVPSPEREEKTVRASLPPDEERTLVDLYRPEPTFEVQVLTNPDGLPIVSVRPASRRESAFSRSLTRGRFSGDHTRLAVKTFQRSLRWRAARAWVLAFGLGGSAMAGAVAVLFFAGLLPGHEVDRSHDRPVPSRSVADGESVLTMREPQIELGAGPSTPTVDDTRPLTTGSRVGRRSTDGSRRRVAVRRARPAPPNPFAGALRASTPDNSDSPPTSPRSAPSAPLGISDSAGF